MRTLHFKILAFPTLDYFPGVTVGGPGGPGLELRFRE